MEDFELHEIGENAYVKFLSNGNQVELKVDKQPYLFTERHDAYVFSKLA